MAEIGPKPAVFRDPVHFFAFGFGTGLSPVAPGTVGTLVGVLVHALYLVFAVPLTVRGVLLVIICLAGIWICDVSAKRLGVHDHPGIVWDEIAGYLITVLLLPDSWLWLVLGFVMFRVFDIAKPWPIRVVDKRVHGGLGIMLDDVIAGVFAGVILLVIHIGLGW